MSIENEIAELNTSIRLLIAKIGEQINALGAPVPAAAIPAPAAPVAPAPAKPATAAKKATETPPPPAAPKSSDSGSTQPPAGAAGPAKVDFDKDVKPLALKVAGMPDGRERMGRVLAPFGVARASLVPAERLAELLAALNAEVAS